MRAVLVGSHDIEERAISLEPTRSTANEETSDPAEVRTRAPVRHDWRHVGFGACIRDGRFPQQRACLHLICP